MLKKLALIFISLFSITILMAISSPDTFAQWCGAGSFSCCTERSSDCRVGGDPTAPLCPCGSQGCFVNSFCSAFDSGTCPDRCSPCGSGDNNTNTCGFTGTTTGSTTSSPQCVTDNDFVA